MSSRVLVFRTLIVALTLVSAACKSATEVCAPGDPLCSDDGGDNGGSTPQLSIADVGVTEGHQGTGTATFTVTLSAASAQDVTVSYATSDGTATAPDDYASASGQLTFGAGTTTETIPVSVHGDIADEGTQETFTVTLSAPVNATIGDGTATGTITDDDDCSLRGTLAVGTTASESLAPGDCQASLGLYVDIWALDVSSEESVEILQSSAEFDTFLTLVDDQGNVLAQDDDSGGGLLGTDSRIVRSLTPGTYGILASSFDLNETGAYQLSVDTATLTISFLDAFLVGLGDCTVNSQTGSTFDFVVDYDDPAGAVTTVNSFVEVSVVFEPSGNSGSFVPSDLALFGSSFSGEAEWTTCVRYGTDTDLEATVRLTNDLGVTSNELTIVVPKPAGAPVGDGPPSVGVTGS